jgi:hypothetical protein
MTATDMLNVVFSDNEKKYLQLDKIRKLIVKINGFFLYYYHSDDPENITFAEITKDKNGLYCFPYNGINMPINYFRRLTEEG